ncbi:hypothetical protein Tco_1362078 [Tanacetum coccineum]
MVNGGTGAIYSNETPGMAKSLAWSIGSRDVRVVTKSDHRMSLEALQVTDTSSRVHLSHKGRFLYTIGGQHNLNGFSASSILLLVVIIFIVVIVAVILVVVVIAIVGLVIVVTIIGVDVVVTIIKVVVVVVAGGVPLIIKTFVGDHWFLA